MKNKPLVVDLDGTLIKSDLLIESVILYVKKFHFKSFKMFIWFSQGRGKT